MAERHNAYVFDAYGTLFDVHAAVRKHAQAVGPEGQRLSEIWRAKQLEYSWVLTLMGAYEDFWVLTERALDFAFAAVPGADKAQRKNLLDAYWSLDCYKEVPSVLRALKERGARIAILSNGTRGMIEAALKSAGLTLIVDEIFSVDAVRKFKTAPDVYDMVTTGWRIYPNAVSFQSSNRWDVAGATKFGFRTVWINRAGVPDEYSDYRPSLVLSSLDGLV